MWGAQRGIAWTRNGVLMTECNKFVFISVVNRIHIKYLKICYKKQREKKLKYFYIHLVHCSVKMTQGSLWKQRCYFNVFETACTGNSLFTLDVF